MSKYPPQLQQELLLVTADTKHTGFYIPFRNIYWGKELKYGVCKNERHLRLFRRNYLTISGRIVHCCYHVSGSCSNLSHNIIHYSRQDLYGTIDKINRYSELGAKQKNLEGVKSSKSIISPILRGIWAFIRGYILKLGFLDGREGLMLAIANAEETYYRYLKLMYL